jgi:hypothetical protein
MHGMMKGMRMSQQPGGTGTKATSSMKSLQEHHRHEVPRTKHRVDRRVGRSRIGRR